jgi:hypothetical protein
MKWSFVIQQKVKASLLLSGIMGLVLGSALLSKNNMEGMERSFSSLYEDRLIPAIDMVYLTENLYRKRLLVERHLFTDQDTSSERLLVQLSGHNQQIDSLVREFEKTYLVKEEMRSLQAFRSRLDEYAALEWDILRLCEAGQPQAGLSLYEGEGTVVFQHTIIRLNELTQIQSSIGQQLIEKSHSNARQSDFLSTLQICVVIVVGLMILSLIKGAKIINTETKPFHLN